MATKDKRIDAYIAAAAPFAQPVLRHFRKLVHQTCPDVTETWKWSFPHFDYQGGPLAHMAAFKGHCAIGFWKASLMKGGAKLVANARTETAMGHLGRITGLADLPPDADLVKFIREGMRLNEQGIKLPSKKAVKRKPAVAPPELTAALAKDKRAKTNFENFTDSQRREYIDWITEAKTEKTRITRIETAVEWIAEGKIRNWKYVK